MEKNVGGIWANKSKDGKTYLNVSVEIEGTKHRFIAFKNKFKEEGDNKPNYVLYPKQEKEAF